MINKIALFIVAFALVVTAPLTEAQQSDKIPRIGYLTASGAAGHSDAFRAGLRELGYVEGKNIIIEWRSAKGKLDRIPSLAAELVRLNVDVIVSGGAAATRAVKEATATIPIVMAQDPDPVRNGFVASLARPGGNITGFSSQTADLSGKRLELLKEIVPNLSLVAVLGTSKNRGNAEQLRETKRAARSLRLQLEYLDVLGPNDIETAFRAAVTGRAGAVLVLRGFVLSSQRKKLLDVAIKSRLPATYPGRQYVEAGGLMSYGVNFNDLFRRAATYVDKILKGANPADLPVEQPTKFELVINLKTAKALGITIPPTVLYQATKIIR